MKIRLGGQLLLTVASVAFCIPAMACAQSQEPKEPQQEAQLYSKILPGRSLKAQPGKVSIIESGADYSYSFKAFQKLPVTLSLAAEQVAIDESAPVSLPAQLTGISFGIEATVPLLHFEKMYWRNKFMPSWYTDNWHPHSSAFRLPVHSLVIYQPSQTWTWLAGVAVYSDFSQKVFPILGLIYKPDQKLTIALVPEQPTISYALCDRVTLFGTGGISSREFEVTKDGLKGVKLQYAQSYAGAGVAFKVNKALKASLSSGYTFKRYLKYGDSLGKVDIKNGLYTEVSLGALF